MDKMVPKDVIEAFEKARREQGVEPTDYSKEFAEGKARADAADKARAAARLEASKPQLADIVEKLAQATDTTPEVVEMGADGVIRAPFTASDMRREFEKARAAEREVATIPVEDVGSAIAEWSAPPENVKHEEHVERPRFDPGKREIYEAENVHWNEVDTERMHGAVPHLARDLLEENPVVIVNGEVTAAPFFDSADGLWGGVQLGDTVAFFKAGSEWWWPATVVELFPDARARVLVMEREGTHTALVPHQASRAPGGACWAHRTEEWTITGRVAAELKLGIGGSTYEADKAQNQE